MFDQGCVTCLSCVSERQRLPISKHRFAVLIQSINSKGISFEKVIYKFVNTTILMPAIAIVVTSEQDTRQIQFVPL